MKQSRAMSLVESFANVAIGFWVAVLTQMVVLPLFDFEAPVSAHLAIAGIFTIVSILRSYALRRIFEALRERSAPPLFGAARVAFRADQASMRQRRS